MAVITKSPNSELTKNSEGLPQYWWYQQKKWWGLKFMALLSWVILSGSPDPRCRWWRRLGLYTPLITAIYIYIHIYICIQFINIYRLYLSMRNIHKPLGSSFTIEFTVHQLGGFGARLPGQDEPQCQAQQQRTPKIPISQAPPWRRRAKLGPWDNWEV